MDTGIYQKPGQLARIAGDQDHTVGQSGLKILAGLDDFGFYYCFFIVRRPLAQPVELLFAHQCLDIWPDFFIGCSEMHI